MTDNILLTFLGSEREAIPYRKEIKHLTGSTNAAVLLQQMLFNYARKACKPFYKFKTPCGHPLYTLEDSWLEELGFTLGEYDGAIKLIGTEAKSRAELDDHLKSKDVNKCVIYYIDRNNGNITWYYINQKAVKALCKEAHKLVQERALRREESQLPVVDPLTSQVVDSKGNGKITEADGNFQEPDGKLPFPLLPKNTTKNKNKPKAKFYQNKVHEVNVKTKPPLKGRNPAQTTMWGNAVTLPIDFEVENDIIEDAENLGYERVDIQDESRKFKDYYLTGKGAKITHYNWNSLFLNNWLTNSYRYGYIKRHGKFINGINASKSRAEIVREQLAPGMFDDVI